MSEVANPARVGQLLRQKRTNYARSKKLRLAAAYRKIIERWEDYAERVEDPKKAQKAHDVVQATRTALEALNVPSERRVGALRTGAPGGNAS